MILVIALTYVNSLWLQSKKTNQPEMLQKQKVHLLPHCMKESGPTSCFNVMFQHRKVSESFNSLMRSHNIYSNKAASSRDIARSFAVLHDIRLMCDGGHMMEGWRYIWAGSIHNYLQMYANEVVKTCSIDCTVTYARCCTLSASVQHWIGTGAVIPVIPIPWSSGLSKW